MTKLRTLLVDQTDREVFMLDKKTLFYPVVLSLPDEVKDTLPISLSRTIDRIHIMRFYCDPSKGDIIEYKGFAWVVLGLVHTPLVKGSTGQDRAPQIRTEFIAKIEIAL